MDFDMDLRHTAQMDGGGGGGGEGPPKAPAATTFANDEEEEDKVGVRRIPQAANAATATITANWRRRLWNRQQQAQQPQGSTTYAAEEQPVTSNLTTSFVQGGKDQTDPKDFPSLSRLQGPPDLLNDVEQHNDDAWETSGYISSTDLDDEEEEDVEGHDDEDDSGHVERFIARHSQRRFQLRRRKNKKKTKQPEPPSNNNSNNAPRKQDEDSYNYVTATLASWFPFGLFGSIVGTGLSGCLLPCDDSTVISTTNDRDSSKNNKSTQVDEDSRSSRSSSRTTCSVSSRSQGRCDSGQNQSGRGWESTESTAIKKEGCRFASSGNGPDRSPMIIMALTQPQHHL